MALWMVRAGKTGEYENKYLEDNKVYLTWDGFDSDLDKIKDWHELLAELKLYFGDINPKTIQNWGSQVWAFGWEISMGDWVVLPSKFQPTLHFGTIKSDYQFHPNNQDPYYHSRDVDWFATDVPRTLFDQDLLYSLGAFLTICRISRNNAEERIKAIVNDYIHNLLDGGSLGSTKPTPELFTNIEKIEPEAIASENPIELEELSLD